MSITLEYCVAAVLTRWGAGQISTTATRSQLATPRSAAVPLQDAKDRIKDAAVELMAALADSPNNDDHTATLAVLTGVVHATKLDHVIFPRLGRFLSVRVKLTAGVGADADYKPAERDHFTRIEEYRQDRADATSDVKSDRWAWDYHKGRIYHTGTYAAIDYVPQPTIVDDGTLNTYLGTIPDRYASFVIARAVEMGPIVLADARLRGASVMGQVAARMMTAVRNNEPSPPVDELLTDYQGG